MRVKVQVKYMIWREFSKAFCNKIMYKACCLTYVVSNNIKKLHLLKIIRLYEPYARILGEQIGAKYLKYAITRVRELYGYELLHASVAWHESGH